MIRVTLVGMALAVGALVTMMLLEGSDLLAVVMVPPLILVFGATFGAAVAGSTASDLRKLGSWFRMAFAADRAPPPALIAELVELATLARKEGMLPLENRARGVADPFLRRGLQMAVDGVPVEQLQVVLDGEIEAYRAECRVAERFFGSMGGYAPTIGIIGTIVGLVQVMHRLQDPDSLGPLIAAAFVATFWGVLSANFIWLPMSAKIRRTTDLRTAQMNLVVEGVGEILAGTNPRALEQKLRAMLPPSEAQLSAGRSGR
jgi:chemotaxis protein MotA